MLAERFEANARAPTRSPHDSDDSTSDELTVRT